jgi:hypothetical protein
MERTVIRLHRESGESERRSSRAPQGRNSEPATYLPSAACSISVTTAPGCET